MLLLADDDDYTKFVESIKHDKQQAVLVAVIPSVNINYKDEDNLKFKNFLHFIIMQKRDQKESYNSLINALKFTQPLILKLFKFMYENYGNIDECMFKDFDLANASIDPVTNYTRTDGYSLSIPLNTSF